MCETTASDLLACQDLRLQVCMVANIVSQLTLRTGRCPDNGSAAGARSRIYIHVYVCTINKMALLFDCACHIGTVGTAGKRDAIDCEPTVFLK